MTTIIHSNVKLSAPKAGTLVLPSLEISGIRHRWHAEAVADTDGTVTMVPDSVGNAPLVNVQGSVTVGAGRNGRRYLDLSAGSVDNNISSNSITKAYTAFSLAALYYWDTTPTSAYAAITTGATMSNPSALNFLSGTAATWNDGTDGKAVVAASGPLAPGWHTLFVGYDKSGNEFAAADGKAITRSQGHGNVDTITKFAIKGRRALGSRVVEASYIDHILTDAEIATLHARLLAQTP